MDDLFGPSSAARTPSMTRDSAHAPLAERMRPRSLTELKGQQHLVGPGKLLERMIRSDRLTSLIFYGPPGSGKTTLAEIISNETKSHFISLNAVSSNAAELRRVMEEVQLFQSRKNQKSIVFIDEIHRFNKSQQDLLMPHVERGKFILIGATTHNPSFSINAPLLSRSTVFELKPLEESDLQRVLQSALADSDRGLAGSLPQVDPDALVFLSRAAGGDARRALNALEIAVRSTPPSPDGLIRVTLAVAEESCQRRMVHYDHDEDYHYDTISAFIKSLRGSDPDAAIYWLAKMIHAGEDPRFIMRRMIIFASEDIGNADPQALILASAALTAIEFVGMPEARIILAHAVTYLSLAPKSNASYEAIAKAMEDVNQGKILHVPEHLRDSHGDQKIGIRHGHGYQYPHHAPNVAHVEHPQPLGQGYTEVPVRYYFPRDSGYEKKLAQILASLR